MDLKETYTALIAELKAKSKEAGEEIKTLTAGLQAKKNVYDSQIRQLEAGIKLLENPTAVKRRSPVKKA